MSKNNNIQKSLIIVSRQQGYDPTEIVGEGNLMSSMSNPNAFTGIPSDQTPNKTFKAPAPDAGHIPTFKKPGDPTPAMPGAE